MNVNFQSRNLERSGSTVDFDRPGPELAVIIPTLNESANIPLLFERLRAVLGATRFEVIVVDDDSPDRTWEVAQLLSRSDSRLRVIRRVGRRGLAGAALEGMLATSAPYVALMDGDLQHDETRLPQMLGRLRSQSVDLVVGSRYLDAGQLAAAGKTPGSAGAVTGLSPLRLGGSRLLTLAARRLLKLELSDPMSGFFMCRREVIERAAPRLSSQGFKLLLDLVASARGLRIEEIPVAFHERHAGESKMNVRVLLECLGLMLAKLSGDRLHVRFLGYAMVGSVGLGVHLLTLAALLGESLHFDQANAFATLVAITCNYLLNNRLTYGDRQRTGFAFFSGLLMFAVICGIGSMSGVGTAELLFHQKVRWWMAGLAGAAVGIWWNYAVTSSLVWRAR
ncbi:glycosyltransferase [Oryzibacter oryziterrae]|uniref:glycosyltransferase n=1 Tax=Oryzibacter oryziterrae TaxID=2766474 RepID=UPI001F411606|nr:glycosyltransferase family 2 protein [Oryzibacter oryziterrae]